MQKTLHEPQAVAGAVWAEGGISVRDTKNLITGLGTRKNFPGGWGGGNPHLLC